MDTSEFDARIKTSEKQIADIFNLLENKRKEIEKSILVFVLNWSQDKVKDALIREFPDKAKDLGEAGVKGIKADLKVLVDQLPDRVNNLLADNSNWPHHKEFKVKIESYKMRSEFEEILSRLISRLFGPTGGILKKYDLIKTESFSEWGVRGTEATYNYGISLSPQLQTLKDDYIHLYEQYSGSIAKAESTKGEKARAEAKDLWEKS
jgi:hypothetical protein